jgi:hypothetical protein
VNKSNPETKIETKAETEETPAKQLTPEERKQVLVESIKKTIATAFIGAGFAIFVFTQFGDASGKPWFSVILLVVLASYYIQKLIYPLVGVRVKEFETKDWIGVEFMIVIFFMVVWTLLLNPNF